MTSGSTPRTSANSSTTTSKTSSLSSSSSSARAISGRRNSTMRGPVAGFSGSLVSGEPRTMRASGTPSSPMASSSGTSCTANSTSESSVSQRGSSRATASSTRSSNCWARLRYSGTPGGTRRPRSPRPCRSRRRGRAPEPEPGPGPEAGPGPEPETGRAPPSAFCTVTERIRSRRPRGRHGARRAKHDTITPRSVGDGFTARGQIPSRVYPTPSRAPGPGPWAM